MVVRVVTVFLFFILLILKCAGFNFLFTITRPAKTTVEITLTSWQHWQPIGFYPFIFMSTSSAVTNSELFPFSLLLWSSTISEIISFNFFFCVKMTFYSCATTNIEDLLDTSENGSQISGLCKVKQKAIEFIIDYYIWYNKSEKEQNLKI